MMRSKSFPISWLVGALALSLLILPSLLAALVWTTLNLFVTAFALVITLVVAFLSPRWRWAFAAVSASVIAFPPYPSWIFWSESDGWKLWIGPSIRSLEIGSNLLFLLVALLLFSALFWSVDLQKRGRN